MNFDLLKKIVETPGISGREQKIRELVLKEIKGLADEVSVDAIGNIIAIKKGKANKKVMAAAHMDEIGFMVTHIDDNGFLKFHTIGGFDPKTLTSQRVTIHGKKDLLGVMGSKPIHVMTPAERDKSPKIDDYFIDLGLSKEEVEKYISVGDSITRVGDLMQMGNCVMGKSLDNRISVYILIETLKALKKKKIPYDFYAVFSVQEEVGLRGAKVATLAIQPDFGFGLDTTIAYDVPGSREHEQITKLGKGTAIKIMDSSTICDARMIDYMKQVATKHKIKYQVEILTGGGTDTAAIQQMTAGGSIVGAVSIPTRHIHQTVETIHVQDIEDSIAMLTNAVTDLETYSW